MRSFKVYFHATHTDAGDTISPGGNWRVVAEDLEGAIKLFRDRSHKEIYRIEVESEVLMA